MTTTTYKSTAITNLDATPVVTPTTGKGAAGRLLHVNGHYTAPVTAGTNTSIIRLARIPTTAKVKAVRVEGAALTKGLFNVGLYWSTSTVDGTPADRVGSVVDLDFFGTSVSFASAVAKTDVTNESGTYTVDKRNTEIWSAAGVTANYGGYFDVALTNVATVSVAGFVSAEVDFVP